MTLIPITPKSIRDAASALKSGEVVAFPTETVYGLGADATNGLAVAKIFETKGRPRFNPLITHVADLTLALELAIFSPEAIKLVDHFWPGPLTLVLKKQDHCPLSDLVTAGLDTVAIRIPDHDVALALLKQANCPVAAPSANISGHVSPTRAEHVEADFKDRDVMILNGGPTGFGLESTVLNLAGERPVLLRPGAVTAEEIEAVLGYVLERPSTSLSSQNTAPLSPGQLESHYAPTTPLRLNVSHVGPEEGLLAFGPTPLTGAGEHLNLSESSDLREAAANLFSYLRELDRKSLKAIAVMPIPQDGLGEAINDRLKRAAAPKR